MAAINGTYRAILGNEVVKAGAVEKSFDNPEDYLNYWMKILNDPSYVDNEELLGEANRRFRKFRCWKRIFPYQIPLSG